MKIPAFKSGMILAILMFILPGCLNIQFMTDIRRDGSIGQMIVFEGDSAEISNVHFALMKDSGWKKEWTKVDKDKHKLVVSKDFRSVEDLNRVMNPADTTLQVIRIQSELKRKFRWFFTRFEFRETIKMGNPFNALNYKNFLNEEEVRLLCLNEENRKEDPKYDSVAFKDIEKKFDDYLFRSMYEDFYQRILPILKEDHSITLTAGELDSKKEEIYRCLIDSIKGDTPAAILDGMNHIMKNQSFDIIKSKYLDRFDGFSKKLTFYQESSDDSYKFNLRMPGLLLQTNSRKIEGSQANWDLIYNNFIFGDYTMSAESRVVNTWAFAVAGALILAALAGLFLILRPKRQRM